MYTILKLRGYDIPQVTNRLNFTTVCNARALAIAIVNKCSVDLSRNLYDGEQQMPWNVMNVFGGSAPGNQTIAWHGISSYFYLASQADDPTTQISVWDGCSFLNLSTDPVQAMHGPNIPGIGFVSTVSAIAPPEPELENLFCRWNPGPRAYHGAEWFEERLYVFGGKASDDQFRADTWYREPVLPQVYTRAHVCMYMYFCHYIRCITVTHSCYSC